MKEEVVIGMDMGGTNLRLGLIDKHGVVRLSIDDPLGRGKSVDAVSEKIIARIEALISRGEKTGVEVVALCLAAPGIIDAKAGEIIFSPNLPGWRNVPLRQMMASTFKKPTILENDANAAAFGEFWKGSGRGANHMVMFTLGTGVGGGLICDNKVIRGCRGMAGELGHITVVPRGGRSCKCGNRGCLEAYSSATAIVEMIGERWNKSSPPPKTAEEACQLAQRGQEVCLSVFDTAGFHLGVAMAMVVNTLNPEVIVIGGGVMAAWDLFMKSAEEEMQARAFRYTDLAKKVSVRKAALGKLAGLVGVAGIYWRAES